MCSATAREREKAYSDEFNHCVVVGITAEVSEAGMLESALIREFKDVRQVMLVFNLGPYMPMRPCAAL